MLLVIPLPFILFNRSRRVSNGSENNKKYVIVVLWSQGCHLSNMSVWNLPCAGFKDMVRTYTDLLEL